jgi:hypothetical protein
MEKLLIITSPNADEFCNYWNLSTNNQSVVKNGNDKYGDDDFQVVNNNGISKESWRELEEKIDSNGYLIMIHLKSEKRFEKRRLYRDGVILEYHVYYYTTQDELLNGDLWSIGTEHNYTGPENDPVCPFDKLRMAIQLGQDYAPAEKAIRDWVEKKIATANMLEVCLCVLHKCLTPKEAAQAATVNHYHLVKDLVVAEGVSVDSFIKDRLVVDKGCFSESYISNLSLLRDCLLASC